MECCWNLIVSLWAGLAVICYLMYRHLNYFKYRGVPYIEAWPLIGNLGPNIRRKLSFAETLQSLYLANPYVKYVGIFDFVYPVVMLRDLELIKSVTVKNFDNCPDHKNVMNEKHDPLFSKNLFFLQGERWRDIRSLLSPAFTSSKMKMMFKLVAQCGADLAEYVTEKASQPVTMEMKDVFTRYTNDVIATTAFGISVNSLKDRENEFYEMGKKATNLSGRRMIKIFIMKCIPPLGKFLGMKIIEDEVNDFFNDVIGSTIAARDREGIVRNDMIQLMMQARDKNEKIKLSVQDMTAQAFIFFFAGFDTSSTLMCFAAHELALNPEVQERLHAEIDAVLAEGDGEITYEALHGMRYLDAVISEALRLYPPASVVERLCTKPFELPPAAPGYSPLTVEAGRSLWIPSLAIHRDPQYFPDPEKFNPERFSEENKGNIPPFAYLPFGLGPRSCIGNRFALMEAKLVLVHLLAKCKLSPCAKTSIPIKLDPATFNTTAADGFWLTIERRAT